MNILIIEDEHYAAQRLKKMLVEELDQLTILGELDSIEDSVEWLDTHTPPDLIFMDIQLADGLSFEIFKQTHIQSPVIFVTAFDQYTLDAFKVTGIDYILKPIEQAHLKSALEKHATLFGTTNKSDTPNWQSLLQHFQPNQTKYKERFLLKQGHEYLQLQTDQIAYFYSEDGISFIIDQKGKRYILEQPLDSLQEELSPQDFFRINRRLIVRNNNIQKIHTYFNNRLKLELSPAYKGEAIVSRDRVKEFKLWLGG